MLDQGFIDTLLANDAYNFLVRKALEAGLSVKRVQSDIAQLQERRKRMNSFANGEKSDQTTVIAKTETALAALSTSYEDLLGKVRTTLEDYSRQQYADAVRVSMQARTDSIYLGLVIGALIGAFTGMALGIGASLLRANGQSAKG